MIATETGGKVTAMAVDIRNGGAIDEAIQTIFDAGLLTGLVNKAIGNFKSLSALDRGDRDMIKGAIQATNAKDRQDRTG